MNILLYASRLLTVPLGYMLYWYGTFKRRSHLRSLGYYLTRQGGKLTFPPYLGERFYSYHVSKEGVYTESSLIDNSDIYLTVGKFISRTARPQILSVLDYYIFYPWCDDMSHGHNCNCLTAHKSWSSITILKKYWTRASPVRVYIQSNNIEILLYKGQKIIKRYMIPVGKLTDYISITLYPFYIEIKCSDQLFSLLGKPFYQVGHYELWKILKSLYPLD